MLDQKRSNMIAYLPNCWYGSLLKIVSILFKKIWTKYDLRRVNHLWCGPRLIIVSNRCNVLSASNWVVPNTITITDHLTIGGLVPILIVS